MSDVNERFGSTIRAVIQTKRDPTFENGQMVDNQQQVDQEVGRYRTAPHTTVPLEPIQVCPWPLRLAQSTRVIRQVCKSPVRKQRKCHQNIDPDRIFKPVKVGN